MASERLRRIAATLVARLLLVAAGAVAVLAAAMGWWGTLAGALLCAGANIAAACRGEVRGVPPLAPPAQTGGADAMPLRALLDQLPVPLVRCADGGARALNRAARTLFDTDDRILPLPPALHDPGADRLTHEGRRWRVSAVDTAADERLVALIDIEAEARAAEARASAEMIDILGHELLNGLSPIVSLADSAVTAAARGDAMLPDILATLARRVEGLEGFTRAYRLLSRLPDPVVAPVPIAALAEDLARLFAMRFGAAVALTVGGGGDGTIHADRDQLTQAIWALLQNAAEAALGGPAPPRVALDFAVAAARPAIRVADSGGGIAAPDRARIFRPFFTTKPHGSGIGLSLAHRIARAHDGDLRLLPCGTTTFELRLAPSVGG